MDKRLFQILFHLLGIANHKSNFDYDSDISDYDWYNILNLSNNHGIAPLLYCHLKTNNFNIHIPQELKDNLRGMYLSNAARNMKLYHELLKIIAILNKENIPVIITKGAALAEFVYNDIALRPMSDIDLIVDRRNVFLLNKILSDLGYESNISNLLSKRHAQWTMHVVYKKSFIFIEAHSGTIFELPNVDPWLKAYKSKISSVQVYVLGTEDMLLHLCSHLSRHLYLDNYTRLIWWFDVVEVLKKYGHSIDWNYVLFTARKNKIEIPIKKILKIINYNFNCSVPDYILNEDRNLNNSFNLSLIDILSYLKEISINKINEPKDRDIDAISTSIFRIPSFHNKIYHIFRRLFPSKNYVAKYLSKEPTQTIYLYYPLYIYKVIIKSFKALSQISKYQKNKYDFFNQLDSLKIKNNVE